MGFYLGMLQPVQVISENHPPGESIFVGGPDGILRLKKTSGEEPGYAGLFTVQGPHHKTIRVRIHRGFYSAHYLGVLAHEATHNYLFSRKIVVPECDPEILTDLAAVYLGFGPILLDAYKPCHWTDVWGKNKSTYSFSLGYLTPSTIRRAIVCSMRMRGWKNRDLYGKIGFLDGLYFKLRLFFSPF